VKRPKPAVEGNLLPAVSRSVAPRSSDSTAPQVSFGNPRNTLSSSSGVVVALGEPNNTVTSPTATTPPVPPQPSTGLPFDEEAKLVYGVILSLRNMVKKLSKRSVSFMVVIYTWRRLSSVPLFREEEERFVSYITSVYKLHVHETLTGYKFVMLTDPQAEDLRFVLRQIYTGPFVEYVVRNPLADMDSQEHGIDNENFRNGTDRLLRGLSIFN
jgi:trafficking protein particle complex subunit 1